MQMLEKLNNIHLGQILKDDFDLEEETAKVSGGYEQIRPYASNAA